MMPQRSLECCSVHLWCCLILLSCSYRLSWCCLRALPVAALCFPTAAVVSFRLVFFTAGVVINQVWQSVISVSVILLLVQLIDCAQDAHCVSD
jgi:hypothetical protein